MEKTRKGMPGPTFTCINAEQFEALLKGKKCVTYCLAGSGAARLPDRLWPARLSGGLDNLGGFNDWIFILSEWLSTIKTSYGLK